MLPVCDQAQHAYPLTNTLLLEITEACEALHTRQVREIDREMSPSAMTPPRGRAGGPGQWAGRAKKVREQWPKSEDQMINQCLYP
jgi:hypothetical protein